jgi:hypothetical protein
MNAVERAFVAVAMFGDWNDDDDGSTITLRQRKHSPRRILRTTTPWSIRHSRPTRRADLVARSCPRRCGLTCAHARQRCAGTGSNRTTCQGKESFCPSNTIIHHAQTNERVVDADVPHKDICHKSCLCDVVFEPTSFIYNPSNTPIARSNLR